MTGFTPQRLLAALKQIPAASCYWIAYSGGQDSHVLLHALSVLRSELNVRLQAVHVNHGLNKDANAWSRHCEAICSAMDIPCHICNVDAAPHAGESPEAAARRARYAALSSIVRPGDCILTAHHQDDQAETVLLQMLRGAGPRGLAGMPVYTGFAQGMLARPLLEFTRDDLHAYAVQHGLQWVDDQSNFDTGYQRNYLRHEVIPLLKSRWSAMARIVSRSAMHCADTAILMDEIAAADLVKIRGPEPDTISIPRLQALGIEHQRNVLRFWLRQMGVQLPETVHLDRLRHNVLDAADDRMPLLTWADVEIRRYRDVLSVMPPLSDHNNDIVLKWDLTSELVLPAGSGRLLAVQKKGHGLNAALCRSQPVTVRYRQGGERCKPAGKIHTREVKKLFQEEGIPPWRRDRIPFIYVGNQLAAVAGLWICQPYDAHPDDIGFDIAWLPNEA
jgi:tRNA(Ile)-lysidine synthase